MTRLIDADAFRREIDTYPPFDKKTQGSSMMANFAKHMLLVALNNMPTIDAVPVRHGKWVPKYIRIGGQDWASGMKCSECGEDALNAEGNEFLTDYCPNCGARMDKDE